MKQYLGFIWLYYVCTCKFLVDVRRGVGVLDVQGEKNWLQSPSFQERSSLLSLCLERRENLLDPNLRR